MAIFQHQFVSTGWSGGPGYTSLYCKGAGALTGDAQADAIRAFFNAIKGELPTEVTVSSIGSYRSMSETSGALVGIFPYTTTPAAVSGSGNATFASPSGVCVTWLTGAFGTHKAIVGRTYLVPAGANVYQNDGTLVDADKAAIQTAAAALVTTMSGDLLVWKRPIAGAGGTVTPVSAARVSDRVAILRSRRA